MSKSILVVDDNWVTRSTLQEALEDEGYEVDTASDGLIAWKKLTLHLACYGVILLDLTMPRMGGLQLVEAFQAQEEPITRLVIAMSADCHALQQAKALGIRHILPKPFDLEIALALIATCFD
ncbi:response regulator [Ktedonospora formicarum]|uniref:Response regulator n=1 Tax=Ktedonospora formicarum TaxID=2778364 RepID=A0A8J3MSL3_9CHLR|nr:response regulator [Ktedonospora formicarum]GHO47187.1 response regulator [Ktedonospora formicarum]